MLWLIFFSFLRACGFRQGRTCVSPWPSRFSMRERALLRTRNSWTKQGSWPPSIIRTASGSRPYAWPVQSSWSLRSCRSDRCSTTSEKTRTASDRDLYSGGQLRLQKEWSTSKTEALFTEIWQLETFWWEMPIMWGSQTSDSQSFWMLTKARSKPRMRKWDEAFHCDNDNDD